MNTELAPFDAAEYLDSDEAVSEYLSAALSENDPAFFMKALSTVARARSMSKLASEAGLTRESLYKALRAESKPRFETVWRIMNALNVQLMAAPASKTA